MEQSIEDLEIAYTTATENIKKAVSLGLSTMAQDIRRNRKRIAAKIEEMKAK